MIITIVIYSIINYSVFTKYGLIGLFLNGLLSSIIPIPTELTISGLILAGESKLLVFIILSISSILGGFIAYYIGYSGNRFMGRFYKKPNKKNQDRSLLLLEKYGWIILFFSPWIPIMGDFIPIIAGVKKYNFKTFGLVIILGKAVKALAIVFFSTWILPFFFP
jgi:membrane protein YqaA with SNARE-associated domain